MSCYNLCAHSDARIRSGKEKRLVYVPCECSCLFVGAGGAGAEKRGENFALAEPRKIILLV